jgi:hypothetical protein
MNQSTTIKSLSFAEAETLASAFRTTGFHVEIYTESCIVEAYEVNGEECEGVFGSGFRISKASVHLSSCGTHLIHEISIPGEGSFIGRSERYYLTASR